MLSTAYLRVEAYGRKGQYGMAVNDINVLRQRAAYKAGESRPAVAVQWEPIGCCRESGVSESRLLGNENVVLRAIS